MRLTFACPGLDLSTARSGDSIAVNGVCLTAVTLEPHGFAADASRETMALTTLEGLSVGDPVNLETALKAGQPLGGHLVSGHVDGIGKVVTEAGCDLARLAGVTPASVIVEILNEDGTMARRPQLEAFARRHKLRIGTIADLIRYRLEKEESVERISEHDVQTECRAFRMMCFEDRVNRNVHLALVHGTLDPEQPVLVRVHVTDTLGDILGVRKMRVMSAPKQMLGISGFGLEVVDYVYPE